MKARCRPRFDAELCEISDGTQCRMIDPPSHALTAALRDADAIKRDRR
jgi:hypothetical protein